MAGTREGGLKAAKKNMSRDPDFYRRIGKIGGLVKGTLGGFASGKMCDCELYPSTHPYQKCAGKRGGANRGKTKAK